MDLVTRRRRIEAIHEVAEVTLVPRVFENPPAAYHGMQIFISPKVDVLVG